MFFGNQNIVAKYFFIFLFLENPKNHSILSMILKYSHQIIHDQRVHFYADFRF